MAAKFIDVPADEWEREEFAEELKALRKADRPDRKRASDFSQAFDALMYVGGFSVETQQVLRVFLSKSKGKAPNEVVAFSETEAGALLPGEEGVASGSLRKRWLRGLKLALDEMAVAGKRLVTREKGSIQLPTRQAGEKKRAARYTGEIAQAVVDIVKRANQLRGLKRDKAYKQATLEVWEKLPDFKKPVEAEKPKGKPTPRAQRLSGNRSRALDRMEKAMLQLIAESKEAGEGAVYALAGQLIISLSEHLAEALGVEKESVYLLLTDALKTATESEDLEAESDKKSGHTQNDPVSQISSVKSKNSPEKMDSTVHFSGQESIAFPDFKTWLAANQERVSAWCSTDTERWQMYEAEKHLASEGHTVDEIVSSVPLDELPTAFKKIKPDKGDIIYAEDFTV